MLSISLFAIFFIFYYQYINLYVILTSKEQNHTFHIIRFVRQERGLFTMSILADDKTNIFGRRLRNLRETVMNKTQKEFSEMLGIPQPSLSAYESGKNKPTIDNVILIADKIKFENDSLAYFSPISKIDIIMKASVLRRCLPGSGNCSGDA